MSTIETWIDFSTDLPRPGSLDVVWAHGSESAKHNTDLDIQIHAYNEHTFILRQNMAVNYEAPFLFLLFGSERALLIDTGATASTDYFPLRATVDDLVDRWLLAHRRVDYPIRTTYQPDEPPLQMNTDQLRDIRAAINEVGAATGRYAFDDFIFCIGEN